MPAEVLVAEMESAFGDSPSGELFDLRARESEAPYREPSNIVRLNQNYRLSVRVRFTGQGLSAIVPNRVRARFFLEGVGTTAEIDIPLVTVTSSASEILLETPDLDPSAEGLQANRVYRIAATVDVENPANGVQRMAGYIDGAILQIRESVVA